MRWAEYSSASVSIVDAGEVRACFLDDGREFDEFAAGSAPDVKDAGCPPPPHFLRQDLSHQRAAIADTVGQRSGQEVLIEQLTEALGEWLVVVGLLDDLKIAGVPLRPGARSLHEEALGERLVGPLPKLRLLLLDRLAVIPQLLLHFTAEGLDLQQLTSEFLGQSMHVRARSLALDFDRLHGSVEVCNGDVQLSFRSCLTVVPVAHARMHSRDRVVSVTVDGSHILPRIVDERVTHKHFPQYVQGTRQRAVPEAYRHNPITNVTEKNRVQRGKLIQHRWRLSPRYAECDKA